MKVHFPARNIFLFTFLALPVILNAQTTVPPPIPLSPMPFIDGLRPTSTAPGALDFIMTIDGANFLPGAVVEFDGLTLTPISVLRNRIVLSVPAAAAASAHTATVKILNPSFNPLQIASSNAAYFPITKQTAGLKWAPNEFFSADNGINPATAIAVGDFNADGHLDVVVADQYGTITVFLGTGNGNFTLAPGSPFSAVLGKLVAMEVGDFNDDGKLDAAVSDGSSVTILFGDGTGALTVGHTTVLNMTVPPCGSLAPFFRFGVGDINGDGLLDLVFPGDTNNGMLVVLGDGTGRFFPDSKVNPGPFGDSPCSVTLGDFNDDGYLDVAMGKFLAPPDLYTVVFAFNDGLGGFSPTNSFFTQTNGDSFAVRSLAAGDMDGDGYLDLVGVGDLSVDVFTNQKNATFLSAGFPGSFYNEVALGDLRGAGAIDSVVSGFEINGPNSLRGFVQPFLGDGKANLFSNPKLVNFGINPVAVRLGDFNEDGRLDVVYSGPPSSPGNDEQTFGLWLQVPGLPLWSVVSYQSGQVLVHAGGQLQLDVLSNSADVPLSITSITSGLDFPISTTASTCPLSGASLAPGSSCTVAFNFQPLSFGTKSETLTIIDNANGVPGSVQTVALSGTAIELDAFEQPPINADGSSVFNAKRGVVPVKFMLQQDGVPTCQLPAATIAVTRTAGGVVGSIDESVFEQAADDGGNFRIDTTSCQYIYNLAAGSLGPGTYLVQIIIDGVAVGSATFGLQ